MPSGPSHSHSSGGHSGGGFSSHGGGGFSMGGMRGPRVPMRFVFFGRTVVVGGAKQALVSFLFVLLFICVFSTFGIGIGRSGTNDTLAENKAYIATMEADNKEYKEALEKAKQPDAIEQGYYTTTAKFKDTIHYEYYDNSTPGIYYYDDLGKTELFYIVYEYKVEYDKNGNHLSAEDFITVKEETYAQYTRSQVNGKGTEIEIVYYYSTDEARWVAINTDYKIDITECYEYQKVKQDVTSGEKTVKSLGGVFIGLIVADVVIVAIIVLVFAIAIKNSKREAELNEEKKKAEIAEARAKASEAEADAAKKNRVCSYCGCSIPDGMSKCPSCGSSKFTKKK